MDLPNKHLAAINLITAMGFGAGAKIASDIPLISGAYTLIAAIGVIATIGALILPKITQPVPRP